MDDGDEIVGSDFVGSDEDEDNSVEALELKLQGILQKKESLERKRKRNELLAKIKQAETEVLNLQPQQQVPAKHEIDKWSIEDLTLFLKAKGIILKDIPVQHLRQLAKSVSDANLPEYKVIIPTSTDRRTVKYKGRDIIFPDITDSSLPRWTDDLSFLPSIEHVTVHAYILSSADFDLERFKNLRNEDSYKMYKGNCVRNIKVHVLQRGYEYVKCSCWLNSNDTSSSKVAWSLIQDDGNIQSAGCSCNEDNGCCKHVVALLLTLASYNKSNEVVSKKEDIVANSQKLSSNYKTKSIPKSDGDTSIKMELKEKPRNIKTDQGGDSNSFIMSICDDESDTEPEVWLPPPSLTERRSLLETSKDQQRRESFKTREISSGGTLPPSEPVATIFNKNAKLRYNEDEQDELLLTTSELIEPTKPQTNRQIASRDDELLSQRERYSCPVDNKRGITNDFKTNLGGVIKEDMDLDSKIRQNLEEMEPLRMQPLMPESEMQSPSLKSSSKLTSVQEDFQFLSNFPMRSIIAEKENHYPAKAPPRASGIPTAQQKIHTSTTFASNSSRFDSKGDNLHSFSPLGIDQKLLPGDILKCQSVSTLKDTETILTSKTPNIETRTDRTDLTKHNPREFMQKPENPTASSRHSLTHERYKTVPTTYHVAHDPIVSRSEDSSPAKYEPMVFAQEQEKPIVQSKYNNYIEPQVQTTIQQQLVSGQTGLPPSNYGIQQHQAVYPSSMAIKNHSDQSTRGNLYPVTNPVLMYPSSNYSQPPPMEYQSKPIKYPSAISVVCMPPFTMNPNARMPVSSNAVNSISINSTTSVGNAFGRIDVRYPGAASNLHSPLVYPTHVGMQTGNIQISTNDVPETTKQEKTCGEVSKSRPHNYQYDEPMDVEVDQSSIVKPKTNRRERRFTSPSVADTKERKTNEVKKKLTYDRTFLLKLSKSKFCKRQPDIPHIPEIMVNTDIHDSEVKTTPLSYTAGYVRVSRDEGTPKVTKKNQPRRGVSPKPMQKLLSAPDEAGLPVDSGLHGMSTEVTKKNKPRPGVSPKPMQKLLSAPDEAGLPVDSGLHGMSTEELMRKAIGAFNMLKNGSEPSMVLNIFLTLQINTEDGLTRIVNLVVDTAIDESELTSTCTSICRILSSAKVPSRNNPGKIISFSMAYRQKCEKIIELGIFSQTSESHQRRLEEITRLTGNIARLMLIKVKDIDLILMKFNKIGSEKCLECFCILLTDVRERMAKCTSECSMEIYDDILHEAMHSEDITETLKYMMAQLRIKLARNLGRHNMLNAH